MQNEKQKQEVDLSLLLLLAITCFEELNRTQILEPSGADQASELQEL